MAIQIKSYNQILGDMIRKIIAETPLNDINTGSVLLTLLEAAASSDFENNVAVLNILELLNIDAVKNSDLDSKAADYGLSRKSASKATGLVNIYNTNIKKRGVGLYVIKPAPIAGQTKLYVNNTVGWSSSGSLYIGRGTNSFEGPINYSSINQYPTYSEIVLVSALQKDHLISDVVIDAQGQSDRKINAGTIVKIPANNQSPEIKFATLRDAVIPAGEDVIESIEVMATDAGSSGNAGIGTVTTFATLPFTGAAVVNTTAFSNGKDTETDDELRNRIKSYSATLARGTATSIVSAVVGISDPDDSKQVVSAIITEPTYIGDPSILYIDDGTGFQPSYAGQSVDILLSTASGNEEFLQLANYPVPRPQVINSIEGPYQITDGSFLRVVVDGEEEVVYFNKDQFLNTSAATASEIVTAINENSTIFKARLTNNSKNILMYPTAHDTEILQVSPIKSTDIESLYANNVLKFSTEEFSYISLYQNSTKLKEKARKAQLYTVPYSQWNVTSSANISISVDGTPAQDRTFYISDFEGASSFSSLTLSDWVIAFNKKFAGLTALATSSDTMMISSNKEGSDSAVKVESGTLLDKWFPGLSIESYGQTAQFKLNRQTGNLRILTEISAGDKITAGTDDSKGFVVSAATSNGTYNLSSDSYGRPSEVVLVTDSSYCNQLSIPLIVGLTISVENPSGSIMRIISSASDTFLNAKPGDFLYITYRTINWFNENNTGLFKIRAKGAHTSSGVDTFIEVENTSVVVESNISVLDVLDIKGFETDGYPQIWRGSYLTTPAAESINNVALSFNKDLMGVKATIYKSNSIKITSNSEIDGSIAVPISTGNASAIFPETNKCQIGNPTHLATRVSNKTMVSGFKTTQVTDENVFLDRHIRSDLRGPIALDTNPDPSPFTGSFSETIKSDAIDWNIVKYKDYIYFSGGNNEGQIRSIAENAGTDTASTQQSIARTELSHTTNDTIQIIEPLSISPDDNMVVVIDQDQTSKTIDIGMSRTGRVNSGSSAAFTPTTTEFSANDEDNEPGITFSNTNSWGKTINGTDFADYSIWMRARNWYSTGGVSGSGGKFIVRASEYGPSGEKIKFSLEYPSTADQDSSVVFANDPSSSKVSYLFGSNSPRSIALSAGYTLDVKGPYYDANINFPNGAVSTGNYYDYTFSSGSFSSVAVGDVLSIIDGSGISTSNSGRFSIQNKSGLTVRVFNPDASTTVSGAKETTTITTVDDILGSPTEYVVQTVADSGGSLHLLYFIIYDTQGSVAVWYDVDNTGAPPPPHGANRAIKISTIASGDAAAVVATKTGLIVDGDSAFDVGVMGNELTITNKINGSLSSGSSGTSGFTVSTTAGSGNESIDGKYFVLHDKDGSVAVWYDVGNDGTSEPYHGADRSIRIFSVNYGDSAEDIAAATTATISADAKFTATNPGAPSDTLIVQHDADGNLADATAGTSGFSISNTNGSLANSETITNTNNIVIFALKSNKVSDIVSKINSHGILELSAIGDDSLTISKSTKEDSYSYTGNSSALAYNHNPNSSTLRDYVSLYDSMNWVKKFDNSDPNFTLKKDYILNGVAPSVYKMNTATNYNSSDVGELFKLVPVTIKNIEHHMTQKALSQLPIVANVSVTNDRKNIQIVSKNLGSLGAVEVVGGNANKSENYIIGESEAAIDTDGEYLLIKVDAYPNTYNSDDLVIIENDHGVKRKSRLLPTDKVSVINTAPSVIEYIYEPKNIEVSSDTQFTITDVSSYYDRPAGYVWRWEHDGSATLSQVSAGDLVFAFGPTLSWDQGNKVKESGDGKISGLPIIAVNRASNYFDIVNPQGKSMVSTSVGVGVTFTADANRPSFSEGHVDTSTNYITASNSFVENQKISFSTSNTLPGGLMSGVTYYAVNVSASGFKVSTVPNGVAISLFTTGTGSHTVLTKTLTNVSSTSSIFIGQPVFCSGVISTGAVITDIGIDTVDISSDIISNSVTASISIPNTVQICPTSKIKWDLGHAAKIKTTSIVGDSVLDEVTVVCASSHMLSTGDYVDIINSVNLPDGSYGPVTVTSINEFTFAYITASNFSETYSQSSSNIIKSGLIPTKYIVEKLNINGLVRLTRKSGESPRFLDCGAAIDDYVVVGGDTFSANNNGIFRIISLDNDSITIINDTATSQLNTIRPFTDQESSIYYPNWTANANVVTGIAGSFKNINVGDWVKKSEDPDSYYVQVLSLTPSTPSLATTLTLGGNYRGISSSSISVAYDMLNDYGRGVELQNINDIQIYEGDSAVAGDKLYVQDISNSNWFSNNNSGSFDISEIGCNPTTNKPFIRVSNPAGTAESNRSMSINNSGFYITEGFSNKFYSIRKINRTIIDDVDSTKRCIYIQPNNRSYKFSESNNTYIYHLGKLGYSNDVAVGVDGYHYYTGLLRRAQRTVDGYEPDPDNYPGRRAVGGSIEILPPLTKKLYISINITTNEGVNLGDISNSVKSVIISYILGLGVGQDVILSEIIAKVMQIKGVAAVTFVIPAPSTERITIANDEKATIDANNIGIS